MLGTRLALAVCFAITLIDGYDTLMLAFIAPLIGKEWALPPGALGPIFAAGFAGAAAGAFGVGAAADRFGRRLMLVMSLVVAGTFSVLCAWAESPSQLIVLRFAAGIGLGGAIPSVSALAADCV